MQILILQETMIMKNSVRQLCEAPAGQAEILQGNMAFAIGCVRGGLHAADGYPGTRSAGRSMKQWHPLSGMDIPSPGAIVL
jgi:hypothetical protein